MSMKRIVPAVAMDAVIRQNWWWWHEEAMGNASIGLASVECNGGIRKVQLFIHVALHSDTFRL